MFYIIETNYVGPNHDQHVDDDVIEITTKPAITNSTHEERTEGWCGTTNDWAIYAHGEYGSEDQARQVIAKKFGDCREKEFDILDDRHYPDERGVVAVFRPGKYEPMDAESASNWCWAGIEAEITTTTTNEEIEKLAEVYESEANDEGYTLAGHDVEEWMTERRDELRDELGGFDYADQDWDRRTTTYWFGEYGVVEGEPGYNYVIRTDGSLVGENDDDSDMRNLRVTDAMRKKASGL